MSPENTAKLYKHFPNFYRQKDLSVQESCMPWGFECGDGWFDIIWDLSRQIDRHVRKSNRGCDHCSHGRLYHEGTGGTNTRSIRAKGYSWCKKCPVSKWNGCTEFAKRDQLDPVAVQVKEKFGELSVYLEGVPDATIESLIRGARLRSHKTCEECGKPGKRAGAVWIKTLCYECRVDCLGKETADKIEQGSIKISF